MTEYEITHGLSQDAPGPLEPVEVAKAPAGMNTSYHPCTDERMCSGCFAGTGCTNLAPTSHPIPTGATGEDERQAFEAWHKREFGSYVPEVTHHYNRWLGWKGRASVGAPAAGDALDVLLLTQALQDLRHAFVIAVGDKSPFARMALEKADSAIAQQKGEA